MLALFYLECKTGYYGEDCSNKCNHCKNNASCTLQSEECDALSCAYPGYQPPLCKGKMTYHPRKKHQN